MNISMLMVSTFERVDQPNNFKEISLEDVFFEIKHSSELRDNIESLRGADVDLYSKYKLALPSFSPCSTFNSKRSNKDVKDYNGVIHLDYDHLEKEQVKFIKNKLSELPFVLAAFVSPGGVGVKVFIKTRATMARHLEYFNYLKNLCDSIVGIDSDVSVKDISRLCFFSSDKDLYLNKDAEVFDLKDYEAAAEVKETPTVEWVFDFTSNKQSFVEGNRNNFTFLFACNTNKYGISQDEAIAYMTQYNDSSFTLEEITRTILGAYKRNVHEFATLQYCSASTMISSVSVQSELIPDDIYDALPEALKVACSKFEGRERDVFFVAAITVLSGYFNNVKGIYDGKEIYPNLYAFVVANAASGKSAAKYAKALCRPYHDMRVEKTKNQMTAYMIDKSNYEKDKRKKGSEDLVEPKKPKQKVFFLPGNSSEASLISLIADNDGKGCVFETEADTISGSNSKEWGGFSHVLRNNYHHEDITRSRKTDEEFTEIISPRFSFLTTGTPEQVKRLIPSAEDGLYSRFLFYSYSIQYEWRSTFTESLSESVDEFMSAIGKEFCSNFSNKENRLFNITKEQGERLDKAFSSKLDKLNLKEEENAISILFRHGLMVYRISMVLSALDSNNNEIVCSDNNFEIALRLINEVFFDNSYRMLEGMGKKTINNNNVDIAYNFMPNEFTRKQGIEICANTGVKQRSADYMLSKMVKKGLIRKIEHGKYVKLNPKL